MFVCLFRNSARQQIYQIFLQQMSEEQRFQTTAKLCQEVLAAIVDSSLPWSEPTANLLQDTLAILASKVIHPNATTLWLSFM
jgi:condensin-2 complex subunit D3